MAPVKLQRIVSCSSQDPAFPAENLLKSGFNHRWKCKAGEPSATVVIQLEKSTVISGIDIGNESSAFVEVLVGRETVPDEFKVILLTSSFMTPMDARNEEQKNRVRMFHQLDLHQPECTEKWDRIKVVCTQPFNKFIQFGLAFITIHGCDPVIEPTVPSSLGRFTLKGDDDDISVGSIFARRKEEPQSDQPPAPGSWRDAAKAAKEKTPKKNTTPKVNVSGDAVASTSKASADKPKQTPDKPKATPDKKTSDESKKRPSTKQDSDKNKEKGAASTTTTPSRKRPSPDESSSSSREKKQMKLNPNITYKPFKKLLEDVEFAISGYVNPGRAEVRSKAIEMGAKYRPDWTPTCTHLICAFANTPKFQQVKGKGKIVVRDWIDDCHRERKKLPWRRYAVDKADQVGTSTSHEEEVWELIDQENESNAARRRNAVSSLDTRADVSSSDTEDEIERIIQRRKKVADNDKDEPKGMTSSEKAKRESEEEEEEKGKAELSDSRVEPEDAVFNVSTDEDSGDDAAKSKSKLPELPSFFKNKYFYIHPSLSKDQIERVERYIVAFSGTLCEILDENVHFVIAERKDDNEDDAPGVFYVRPDWIWECNDAGRLAPFRNHEL